MLRMEIWMRMGLGVPGHQVSWQNLSKVMSCCYGYDRESSQHTAQEEEARGHPAVGHSGALFDQKIPEETQGTTA